MIIIPGPDLIVGLPLLATRTLLFDRIEIEAALLYYRRAGA